MCCLSFLGHYRGTLGYPQLAAFYRLAHTILWLLWILRFHFGVLVRAFWGLIEGFVHFGVIALLYNLVLRRHR
jgi:hypothetical protein